MSFGMIAQNQNMVKKPNCFIVYIKTDDIYKNNAEYVESRFGTLNYELDWPSPK